MKIETIGIVATYIVMLIINFALSKLFDFLPNKGINIPVAIYGTVMEIGILLPAIIYTKMKGESLVTSFGFRKIRLRTVLLTVGLTLLSLPPFWSANVLSQVFVPNTAVEAASEMTSGSLFGSFFVVVIAASICEEIALRGFCFNRLKKVTYLLTATAISAIMFGIIHLNINQMCYAIVLGIIFALANHASGSIWTSIIMHSIINSLGFIILLLGEMAANSAGMDLAEATEMERVQDNNMLITGLVLLAISIIFLPLIKRVLRKIAVSENNPEAMTNLGLCKETNKLEFDGGIAK